MIFIKHQQFPIPSRQKQICYHSSKHTLLEINFKYTITSITYHSFRWGFLFLFSTFFILKKWKKNICIKWDFKLGSFYSFFYFFKRIFSPIHMFCENSNLKNPRIEIKTHRRIKIIRLTVTLIVLFIFLLCFNYFPDK